MADRYSKDNILEYPKLAPERHYESENPSPYSRPPLPVRQPDKMLETLDDLDNLYKIADLLPPDLARIIKEITDVLSKHSQGLIIMRLKRQMNPPYDEPGKTKPKKPDDDNQKGPDKPQHKWDDGPWPPSGPTEPEKEETHGFESNPWPPSDIPKHESEQWPLPPDHPGVPDSHGPDPGTYITNGGDGSTLVDVITGGGDNQYVDADVDDIFSAEPDVEINVVPSESLVDLARKAYEQDDADIKEHYTSEMTTISQRFFQVMTALAEDSNMLDYSDLMQPFDGTAVTTSDPNQQHLIDEICKNQVMYDQSLRQMNLTHTAAKTLVMTRGMTAAEGERERYLKSEYKTNMPSVVSGLSNDLLQKNRESAEKKYKESSYNMYKYLDSAAKMTNAMLNMKIDSAIAKGQLANTGSNIFAYTPPPQPLPDDVDDNYDTVKDYEKREEDFLKDQAKDQKKASEIDSGMSGSNSSSVASAGSLGGGNVDPSVVFNFLKKCGYNAVAACGIMGNIRQESGFNTGADDGVEAFGLCQWTAGRQQALKELASSTGRSPLDAGVQLDYLWQELQDYEDLLPSALNSYGSAGEAAEKFEVTFERAGVPMMENRISYANGFYQQFNGK